MNYKTPFLAAVLLIVLAIAQWLFMGNMIYSREKILNTGKSFRFRTEPIDPSDPFRGKYIMLNFRENTFTTNKPETYSYGEDIYVQIENKNNFAVVKAVSKTKPASGDFVKAKCSYASTGSGSTTVHIMYPFDKYYMEEYKATKAEELYREANRDSLRNVYALVKVADGTAVIENIFVNDTALNIILNK